MAIQLIDGSIYIICVACNDCDSSSDIGVYIVEQGGSTPEKA